MARAKIVHSEDAVTVIFEGNKASPEPTTGIIKFPGGHVEVARCSDGSYWVHTSIDSIADIEQSRIDYAYPVTPNIVPIPDQELVTKIAVRIKNQF